MPFLSKAQHRLCRAKNDPNWDCSEWFHATRSYKRLPQHIRKKKPAKDEPDTEKAAAALAATLAKIQARRNRA